jgi:hypothetical protein
MFASNPFVELSATMPMEAIQVYVILMFFLVLGGTIFDMLHKRSAEYFFAKAKAAEASRKRELGGGEKFGIAVQTAVVDVATSGEFCNPRRRVSHLFTMYGFIIFILSTIALVFAYPNREAPEIVAMAWHLGAAMVMFGGYWFWFFIRVDVSAEGNPWHRVVKADMFILSLLGTTTFGFLWSIAQSQGAGAWTKLFLAFFILSSVVLFGGVIWSKFAHMFFKPAAAYNERIIEADGSHENLPEIGDLSDPEVHKRFPDIREYMGTNPAYMGLGIKRERPEHY